MYGALPLEVPRTRETSSQVTILSRLEGVTSFTVRKGRSDVVVPCRIDTINEWILYGGIFLDPQGDSYRLKSSGMNVARLVAADLPRTHPDRVIVDHANRDTTDNTALNLHWVTERFNGFNREQRANQSGFRGVQEHRQLWQVVFQDQSSYHKDAETAACSFNLLARLAFGDQLDKCHDLLNKVDEDRVAEIFTQSDGVSIHRVNNVFLIIFKVKVWGVHDQYEDARKAATTLIANQQAQKKRREAEWKAKKDALAVEHTQVGKYKVAFFSLTTQEGKRVKVLVDNEDWKELRARSAVLRLNRGNPPRAIVRLDGCWTLLSRWVCPSEEGQVVDHKSRNVYDNRRDNLRATDFAANAQNATRQRGVSGWIGVSRLDNGRWEVKCSIKGENRFGYACVDSVDTAIELYDVAVLQMHGSGARLNRPEKESEYLARMQDDQALMDRVETFLADRDFSSRYLGVYFQPPRGRGTSEHYVAVIQGKASRHSRNFNTKNIGAEVQAAICYDLWRLKADATFKVSFERMRPYYFHCIETLTDQGEMVEKCYQRLGGDEYVRAMANDAEEAATADDEDM